MIITKKVKYTIQSLLAIIFIYLVSTVFPITTFRISIFTAIVVSVGAVVIHNPNVKLSNFPYSIIVPFHLVIGAVLFLNSFPNLANIFKAVIIFGFGFLYYIVSLVDNIFLVVHDRKEVIPLYRVAVTWSLILLVIIAIPLFSGLMRRDLSFVEQTFMIALVSFLFSIYQIWSLQFDEKVKKVGVGETLLYSGVVVLFVAGANLATSFIPAETFLKALFLSTVLMFALNYVSSHLKKEINKRILFEYFGIVLLFLIILLSFTT